MILKFIGSIILGTLLLEAKSCDKKNVSDVPSCIQQMITDFQAKPVQNPPASIYQYDFNGQQVYYVTAPCCDQLNTLYDANCNVVCKPSGGITGKGDGKCPDFNTSKSNEKLIWKDERQ
jgi:hypothetical protein